MDWSRVFCDATEFSDVKVTMLDVGCGYGGLLSALGVLFPDRYVLGVEIRVKAVQYVRDLLVSLRRNMPGSFLRTGVLRTNAMKYMPHFIHRGDLEKIFILFPDPHFKRKNFKRRIVTPSLASEYAYLLGEGGYLYIATDVHSLFNEMVQVLNAHPQFERIDTEPVRAAPHAAVVNAILCESDEAKRVDQNLGDKYYAVYERVCSAAEMD